MESDRKKWYESVLLVKIKEAKKENKTNDERTILIVTVKEVAYISNVSRREFLPAEAPLPSIASSNYHERRHQQP